MLNEQIVDFLLKLTLSFITLSLGFGVNITEIRTIFKRPGAIVLGLVSQMIVLPLTAFIICYFIHLDPLLKIGIMIIALCPGGTTANLLSFIFKVNVGLSISLTAINGLLCLVTIPLLTNLSAHFFTNAIVEVSIPVWDIVSDLLIVIIIPGAIGVFLNSILPNMVKKTKPVLRIALPLLLALIFGIKFFGSPEQGGLSIDITDIKTLLLPLLLLNILGIILGFLFANYFLNDPKNGLTIAIETGLQNTALALLIGSSTSFIDVQKPAVIYAAFSFFTTALVIYLLQKKVGVLVSARTD